RDELVQSIVDNKNLPEDLSAFFALMKKLTVQGYMTSKYYLTNVRVYKLVPGKYYGCIPVTKLDKKGASI
ncbi:MAG TPA: gluconate 2-dehydrogenase subunit 3 family protein, partial [Segetibacter sp.]